MKWVIYFSIMLLASLNAAAQDITDVEYFFDTDMGFGKNNILKAGNENIGTYLLNVKTDGMSTGYHALYYRTRDKAGRWSHTQRKLVEIIAAPPVNLVSYEYFFDTDMGMGKGTPIQLPVQELANSTTFMVDRQRVSEGNHTLFVRAWNKYSGVSQTQWRSVVVKYVNCTIPTITMADGVLTASSGTTFQWYKEGQKIQGATKRTYTPTSGGQYSVEVSSGSCTTLSKEFSYVITAVEPAGNAPIDIFPNPFQDQLTIRNKGGREAKLFLYSLNGNLVRTIYVRMGDASFDVRQLPAGMYVCKVQYGQQVLVSTRVITKY